MTGFELLLVFLVLAMLSGGGVVLYLAGWWNRAPPGSIAAIDIHTRRAIRIKEDTIRPAAKEGWVEVKLSRFGGLWTPKAVIPRPHPIPPEGKPIIYVYPADDYLEEERLKLGIKADHVEKVIHRNAFLQGEVESVNFKTNNHVDERIKDGLNMYVQAMRQIVTKGKSGGDGYNK